MNVTFLKITSTVEGEILAPSIISYIETLEGLLATTPFGALPASAFDASGYYTISVDDLEYKILFTADNLNLKVVDTATPSHILTFAYDFSYGIIFRASYRYLDTSYVDWSESANAKRLLDIAVALHRDLYHAPAQRALTAR